MPAFLFHPMAVWPDDWLYFTGWQDLIFAGVGLMMGVLLVIWWRQQSEHWYSIFAATLLAGTLFDVSSYFLFVVPPHYVGCPRGCLGDRKSTRRTPVTIISRMPSSA